MSHLNIAMSHGSDAVISNTKIYMRITSLRVEEPWVKENIISSAGGSPCHY